jgi:hypothetical protein
VPFSGSDFPVTARFYFHMHDDTPAFHGDGSLDLLGGAVALAESRQTAWGLIYDLRHEVKYLFGLECRDHQEGRPEPVHSSVRRSPRAEGQA